jgi:hypothetical protein
MTSAINRQRVPLRAHRPDDSTVSVDLPQAEPAFYPRPARRSRGRWGLITMGMLAFLLPLLLCQFVIAPWISDLWGSLQFNQTRTYQADQTLDGVPTHFIAINLHGEIDIIVLHGNGTKVTVYGGMTTGHESDTVSLSFDERHNMTLLVNGEKAAVFTYEGNGAYKLVQQ